VSFAQAVADELEREPLAASIAELNQVDGLPTKTALAAANVHGRSAVRSRRDAEGWDGVRRGA